MDSVVGEHGVPEHKANTTQPTIKFLVGVVKTSWSRIILESSERRREAIVVSRNFIVRLVGPLGRKGGVKQQQQLHITTITNDG